VERRIPALQIENRTGEAIVIVEIRGELESKVLDARPGRTDSVPMGIVGDDGCVTGDGYVARDAAGRRTLPRRVCDGETWTITDRDFLSR